MSQIVILGGGFGGVVAATELRKKIGKEHKVVLIDKAKVHLFTPSLLWLVVNERTSDDILRDLDILNKKGIEYINAEVQKIDTSSKKVITSVGERDYDYLVISLGAGLARDTIPGYRDAVNFYCLKGAEVLRDELKKFEGGKMAIVVASTPFRCPAAPYEAVLLIDAYLSNKGVREKTQLAIYTPEALPMPVAGPIVGNRIKDILGKRNISFNPQMKLKSIENNKLIFESGDSAYADLIPWVPPHTAPDVVKDSRLTDDSGWIPVDGKTMETNFDGVFAIGDVTSNRLPSGMMLPKAGVFAHGQAEVVANNIAAKINKTGQQKEFNGKGACFVEMGHGRAGFASGNFYAEPRPDVDLKNPGKIWHWGKIAVEKWWMWKWF